MPSSQLAATPRLKITVLGHLVLEDTNWPDPVNPHRPTDAPLANTKSDLFGIRCYPRRYVFLRVIPEAAIAAKAHAILFPDVCQYFHGRSVPTA